MLQSAMTRSVVLYCMYCSGIVCIVVVLYCMYCSGIVYNYCNGIVCSGIVECVRWMDLNGARNTWCHHFISFMNM